jgi:uncharacterized protein YxeA
MNNYNMKKNLPLIIGLAIPILMVAFIALSIYIPNSLAHPTYNFLYVVRNPNQYEQAQYIVEDSKVILKPYEYRSYSSSTKGDVIKVSTTTTDKLYIYDVTKGTSKMISFNEAKNLSLDSDYESPEGYALVRPTRDYSLFDLFGTDRSENYGMWYLKKGSISKKIKLEGTGNVYYYDNSAQFLAWIQK